MSLETTRGTVYAGPTITDYVRVGRGPTVLLLGPAVEARLLAALAVRFRVIAPELPRRADDRGAEPRSAPPVSWLRDFLDGLGLSRVSVVADRSCGLSALCLCLADPERVDRVVLLVGDQVDMEASSVTSLGTSGGASTPLLVRGEIDGDDLATEVLSFLAGA